MPIEPGRGGRIAELARQKGVTAEELLLDQEPLGVSSQNDGGRKFMGKKTPQTSTKQGLHS